MPIELETDLKFTLHRLVADSAFQVMKKKKISYLQYIKVICK